ncbi:cell division protein FtsA, partial [bacterium]|nr:cell division protein FtsA [bacterium]
MIVTPQTNSIYCAIDIGTSSIKTLIAQKKDDSWHILGFGVQPTEGVKKGCITDLEKTTRSVHYALEEAELKAGCKANIYVTNFSDQYINTLNSKGIIPIRNSRVNADDIKEVIKAAQAIALPPEHRILHAIPQYYAIDHHRKIIDPLGMPGIRLEADVHLVTASMHAMKTKLQILSNFGIQADYVVFDPLAAAYGVLLHDEKELGVALIDLGGGTSKMSIFHQNRLLSSKILPIGGDHVTADLALAFRTPVAAAEVLKMRHGGVHAIDVEIK